MLIIYDYYDNSVGGSGTCGVTELHPVASNLLDTIRFNTYCMDTLIKDILGPELVTSTQLAVIRHELGHSLGLDHSNPEIVNVMWAYWDDGYQSTTFGDQDKSDYNWLWGTIKWAAARWWPK